MSRVHVGQKAPSFGTDWQAIIQSTGDTCLQLRRFMSHWRRLLKTLKRSSSSWATSAVSALSTSVACTKCPSQSGNPPVKDGCWFVARLQWFGLAHPVSMPHTSIHWASPAVLMQRTHAKQVHSSEPTRVASTFGGMHSCAPCNCKTLVKCFNAKNHMKSNLIKVDQQKLING